MSFRAAYRVVLRTERLSREEQNRARIETEREKGRIGLLETRTRPYILRRENKIPENRWPRVLLVPRKERFARSLFTRKTRPVINPCLSRAVRVSFIELFDEASSSCSSSFSSVCYIWLSREQYPIAVSRANIDVVFYLNANST